MPYVDMDFLLALIKDDDSLKQSALELHRKHRGNLWTSAATIVEALLICRKKDIDPEEITGAVYALVDVRGMDLETAMRAAHFMKHNGLRPLDSVHASFAFNDEIISSDKKYAPIGIRQIFLERL